MTKAINNCRSNSLILMDEFGRGTTEEDGISILVGVLKHFLSFEENCPHILVSTHIQQMIGLLPETPLLEFFKFAIKTEDGVIYFLHTLTSGK